MSFEVGYINSLPVIISNILEKEAESIEGTNINTSKADWDSFETSWDFKKHPMIWGTVMSNYKIVFDENINRVESLMALYIEYRTVQLDA